MSHSNYYWSILFAFFLLGSVSTKAQQLLFTDQPPDKLAAEGLPPALRQARTLRLDLPAVRAALRTAEVFYLPMPTGAPKRYRVRPVVVLPAALAARFPQIQTYEAQGIDDPTATARLEVSPTGFHAQVLSASQMIYIDPAGDSTSVVVVDRAALVSPTWSCQTAAGPDFNPLPAPARASGATGALLRTYRLAVACTPQYCLAQGNTIAHVLAAVVTSINRVNGVYEREMAVRLVLVAQQDQLLFLSGVGPVADPAYSNNNGAAMLLQNQRNLDRIIGSDNYDIGHVFSTGGNGIAYVKSACNAAQKAGGVSGQANPAGDGFDIDYVAHEIGHQLGCTHTFSGYFGTCSGANRVPYSAYEPGSGITVMSYAGICAPENLAPNSIPYFHSHSYDEVLAFTAAAGDCATVTATGNQPPVPDAGPGYAIPISTPFRLTGNATDPDGDSLTHSWEEFDLNPLPTPIGSPTGDAPIFRSFAPTTSASRFFPQLNDVVNNTQTIGELLPTYNRRLHFRFVAHDNRLGGGGVAYDSTSVLVVSTAGPFRVQLPNAGTEQWIRGTNTAVTWTVAHTTEAPIHAARVDILLSTDGGYTYPTMLLAGAPNTGLASFLVPGNAALTTQARVMVRAAGNVFYDISDHNFSIVAPLASLPNAAAMGVSVYPNPSTGHFLLTIANNQRGEVGLRVLDALGRTVLTTKITKDATSWQYPLYLGDLAVGIYYLQIALPAGPVMLKIWKQ